MLSKEQKKIYDSKDDKIIVLAAPASGKTRLLTEKVKKVIKEESGKIVVITFTNAAADEMIKRIGEIPTNVFIGTVHSYANFLLLSNGIDTQKYLDQEEFDELFELLKENPQVIEPVSYLFLDEAQDSTEEQFEFIFDLVQPKKFFVVGDFRQSIYSFSGARPDILIDMTMDYDVSTYDLLENYRNGSNILEYARRLIRALGPRFYDKSICKSNKEGQVIESDYSIPTLIKYIRTTDTYGDWFVLTRTNEELDNIYNAFQQRGVPCETFKKSQLDNEELYKRMARNTVKILTIHTAKGLENKNVAVIGARFYSPEERRIAYVAATRAKELLLWMKKPKKKTQRVFSWE